MYRSIKGRSILTKRAREYYKRFSERFPEANKVRWPVEPVAVTILLHPPKRFKYDVDNYFKMILDCLKGRWFTDDSQIVKLTGYKREKDPHGVGFANVIMEARCKPDTITVTETGV